MKIKRILVTFLSFFLLLSLVSCGGPNTPEETTVPSETTIEIPTEAPTEPATEAPTEVETDTEAPEETVTEAPTEAETAHPEEVKKYREDWDEDDPENPFYNLIPVGKSYDGKTTCYDGRYDFGYTICRTSDGEYFYSVQEAVWHLEDMGGGSILMTDHTDICLKLEFPNDFCDYRLYYQFLNVDFVFNYGNIYDDSKPNADGINGYAYYADLYILDAFNGLGDTHIWMIGGNEGFDEPGCYLMLDEFNEDPEYYYLYQYVLESNLDTWPGLPMGESLP